MSTTTITLACPTCRTYAVADRHIHHEVSTKEGEPLCHSCVDQRVRGACSATTIDLDRFFENEKNASDDVELETARIIELERRVEALASEIAIERRALEKSRAELRDRRAFH